MHRSKDDSAALAAEIKDAANEFTRIKRLEDDIVTSIETAVTQSTTEVAAQITAAPLNTNKKDALKTLKAAVNKVNDALKSAKESMFYLIIFSIIVIFRINCRRHTNRDLPRE